MEGTKRTGYPSTKTVFQNMQSANDMRRDTPAIEYFQAQLTYNDLFEEIDIYAKAFRNIGVEEGTVVTICLPSVPSFIVSYYALNKIGAIANRVSFAFLKNDPARYTDDKKSGILVILDRFYYAIESLLDATSVHHVILVRLSDYMPDSIRKTLLLSLAADAGIPKSRFRRCLFVDELRALGQSSSCRTDAAAFSDKRDTTYLYTSGTTGLPKCAVFRDQAINSLVEMHKGLPIHDAVGDRSLLVIPPYYATSLFYEVHLQLCRGLTLVLEPTYDKNTFAYDLRDGRINRTLAAMSHYAALMKSDLKQGDLQHLKIPGCGGEAVTRRFASAVTEKLRRLGAQDSLIIGGGQTENGSCVFVGYDVADRVNETGYPLPGIMVRLLDPDTGAEVDDGRLGELLVSSPAAMDRYYDDPSATNAYFSYDKNGVRWAHPHDMAIRNRDGAYTMKGRENDSFTDSNKRRIFLFDTEELVSDDPAVLECEAIAIPGKDAASVQVLHVVLSPESKEPPADVIRRIYAKVPVYGIKIRETFGTSEISGKRDVESLRSERNGFVDGQGRPVDLSAC